MWISHLFQTVSGTIKWESVPSIAFCQVPGAMEMEDDIHGDETIREVLDRHPPHASREELARLELRFRDLEGRVERVRVWVSNHRSQARRNAAGRSVCR